MYIHYTIYYLEHHSEGFPHVELYHQPVPVHPQFFCELLVSLLGQVSHVPKWTKYLPKWDAENDGTTMLKTLKKSPWKQVKKCMLMTILLHRKAYGIPESLAVRPPAPPFGDHMDPWPWGHKKASWKSPHDLPWKSTSDWKRGTSPGLVGEEGWKPLPFQKWWSLWVFHHDWDGWGVVLPNSVWISVVSPFHLGPMWIRSRLTFRPQRWRRSRCGSSVIFGG